MKHSPTYIGVGTGTITWPENATIIASRATRTAQQRAAARTFSHDIRNPLGALDPPTHNHGRSRPNDFLIPDRRIRRHLDHEMTDLMNEEPSYDDTVVRIKESAPRLALALQQAQQQRTRRSTGLVGGARFKGIEELLEHLIALSERFASDQALNRLAFLVQRARADLETATEATLSGYVAVAADAMRDVMEIENLLLDFAVAPDHIDEWLTGDRKALVGKFAPARIRDRLHAAGEGQYAHSAESIDYRAHSAALHVSPYRDSVANRGFSTEQGWGGDAGFWEIFEHNRRLLRATQRLTGSLAPGSPADQLANRKLPDVEDAWERTQEMQAVYIALLTAIASNDPVDQGRE